MSRVYLSFEIEAPLAEVWDLGRQPRRIPDWQFDIAEVRGDLTPIQQSGRTYCLVYRRFRRDLESSVTVRR